MVWTVGMAFRYGELHSLSTVLGSCVMRYGIKPRILRSTVIAARGRTVQTSLWLREMMYPQILKCTYEPASLQPWIHTI